MTNVRGLLMTAWIGGMVMAFGAWAGDALAKQPDAAQVEARIQEAKTRLELTPDQEAQLRPVMQKRSQKMMQIRENHAGDSSRRAKRAMLKEARPVQQEYENEVRAILSDSQEAEWDKMRMEARQRIREQRGRGAAAD